MSSYPFGAVIMQKLPIPPTANRQLMPVKRGRYARLIKTNDARSFDSQIETWMLKASDDIHTMRTVCKSWVKAGFTLRVDLTFHFAENKLYTKGTKKKPKDVKRMDVNNRIKSVIDAVSKILEIDDKYFFAHFIEKVTAEDGQNYCTAIATPLTK